MRRERARRVCGGRIAGEQGGLASAAAEIKFTALATAARLGHPASPPEAAKRFRLAPDLIERASADVVELQARYRARRRAGEYVTDWVDGHVPASPPAHAGLRAVAEVVGPDIEDR
jgi:hypothetical protein